MSNHDDFPTDEYSNSNFHFFFFLILLLHHSNIDPLHFHDHLVITKFDWLSISLAVKRLLYLSEITWLSITRNLRHLINDHNNTIFILVFCFLKEYIYFSIVCYTTQMYNVRFVLALIALHRLSPIDKYRSYFLLLFF